METCGGSPTGFVNEDVLSKFCCSSACGAWPSLPARCVLVVRLGGAKRALGFPPTVFLGILRWSPSTPKKKKTLSLITDPPIPNPQRSRRSVGLKLTREKTPGEV